MKKKKKPTNVKWQLGTHHHGGYVNGARGEQLQRKSLWSVEHSSPRACRLRGWSHG